MIWMIFTGVVVLGAFFLGRATASGAKKNSRPNTPRPESDQHVIDTMTGVEFEETVAQFLKENGYRVRKTPASHDYGADLLIHDNGIKLVVQLKRYSGNVGVSAVQEVLGAIPYYKAHAGMIITNRYLTRNAKRLALKAKVKVLEREDIIGFFHHVEGQSRG